MSVRQAVAATAAPQEQSPPAVKPLRIRHVDSLRAIAAGLVVWTHAAETFSPLSRNNPAWLGFLRTLPSGLNLGRVGVTIFFAISGFVICRSFSGPREGGARRFVIKRACRLYPAFWVSMLTGIVIWWHSGGTVGWQLLAANATMAPGLFGQERLIGLYWTLEIELAFYGLCLCLYHAGWLGRRGVIAGIAAGCVALPRILHNIDHLAGTHLTLSGRTTVWLISLAVMFWGAVFRMVYDETGGFRHAVLTRRSGVWLLMLLTLVLMDVPAPRVKWVLLHLAPGSLPDHMAVIYALLIFSGWIAWLRVDNPVLTYLGVVSYSLYLFHPAVMSSLTYLLALVGPERWMHFLPLWILLILCAALSVGLAMVIYRWVERPAIALGKRWTRLEAESFS